MRTLAVIGILLALTAGCSKPKPQADPPPSVSTSLTPSAAPSPSAAPTTAPTTAGGCTGSVSGGSDPHRAVIQAWLCRGPQPNLTDAAAGQINSIARDIDMKWTFERCDGTAGANYCAYRNSNGSDLILRVPSQPGMKISEVKFDRTVYHTNAEHYARHFIDAWITGNELRMRALATPAVLSFAASHAPPPAPYTVTLSPAEVWIFEITSGSIGYRILLQNQLGRAGAVTGLHQL